VAQSVLGAAGNGGKLGSSIADNKKRLSFESADMVEE
jgi:hypothetical protein